MIRIEEAHGIILQRRWSVFVNDEDIRPDKYLTWEEVLRFVATMNYCQGKTL